MSSMGLKYGLFYCIEKFILQKVFFTHESSFDWAYNINFCSFSSIRSVQFVQLRSSTAGVRSVRSI